MTEYNRNRILIKALRKACKNGYAPKTIGMYEVDKPTPGYLLEVALNPDGWSIFDILYSHEFAKAHWGDEMVDSECKRQTMCYTQRMALWAWKLMEMVVYSDPCDFLAIDETAAHCRKVQSAI